MKNERIVGSDKCVVDGTRCKLLPTTHFTLLTIILFLIFHFSFYNSATAQTRRTDTGNLSGAILNSSSTGSNTIGPRNNNSNPFANDTSHRDSTQIKGIEYHKEIPDSVLRERVFMFHYEPRQVKINELWNPTLDPTAAQFSTDRLDGFNGNYYLGKGIVGQPHIGLFPTLAGNLNNDLQPDPNVGYSKRRDNIWLYQTMTPYSRLSYNSSLNKDYQVSVTHTQNVRPGWNIAFNYDLICPKGNYPSSNVKNHYLDATTNYFSPDSRLQATAGIIWQSFNISENGGISDDTYFTNQLQSNRAGVPVQLYNVSSRHRETAVFARASYNLVRQVDSYRQRDSIAPRRINDTLTALDTSKVTDTISVGKPHVINPGVFGIELNYDRRKRAFADSTLWTEKSAFLFWTNDAYPDHRWCNPLKITVGINPRQVSTVLDSADTTLYQATANPFASVHFTFGRSTLLFDGEINSNIGDDFDYHLATGLEIPFDSAGHSLFRLNAVFNRETPCLLMEYHAAKAGLTLRQQITNRFETQITGGEWLDLMLRANHLSHNVWYDSTLTVHEGTRPLWLMQVALSMRFKARWLHLDMQQLLQYATDAEQMPVPLWASKNSLYADMHLFSRALRLQVGVDVRYHTPFHSPNYDPYTGIFFHQDETTVGGYIWGDLFVNIQVKRATIYVKAGHLNALWETSPTYLLLPHYPGQKFGLFWGLTWNFFD